MSLEADLMSDLSARGIRLYLEDGRLCYEGPKGAMDAELRERVGRLKPRLIDLLRRAAEASAPITRSDAQAWPLSEQQERIWLASRIQEGAALHLGAAIELPAHVVLERLDAALCETVARHDCLRTRFVDTDAGWRQILSDTDPFRLERVQVPETRWADQVPALVHEAYRAPFDLARESPLRARLLVTETGAKSVLVIVAHHVAVDAVSINLLLVEIAARYEGREPGFGAAIRYVDYAAWQRSAAEQARLAALADDYAQSLEGAPPVHRLPTCPRPPRQDFRGRQWRAPLPASVVARLDSLAQTYGATLFMALEAVFATLLSRYSGEDDIVLATPTANRTRPETEQLVGCLAEMLVLRVQTDRSDTFASLLAKVRNFNERAYRLQDVPFRLLTERLKGAHNQSHHPVYQITLGLQPSARPILLGGSECRVLPHENETSQVDLGLDIMPSGDGWVQRWEYDDRLFDPSMIERMAAHLETLASRVAERPDAPLATLGHLTEEESPSYSMAMRPLFHLGGRFIEVARRTPEATALVVGGERLTFEQLRQRACKFAARLRELGVGPSSLVGVSTEKTPLTYAALLGVVLAGGAYVPLDPSNPDDRTASICASAKVALALGGERLLENWPATSVAPAFDYAAFVRNVDAEAFQPDQLPPPETLPAYLMFSSGTSGAPKGIAVTHAGVARLVGAEPWLTFAAGETALHAATLAFDASTYELWAPWLQGAAVVTVEKELLLDPTRLSALIDAENISAAFLTTAYFNRLSEHAPEIFKGLRRVLFGGEQVSNTAVARALRAAPDTEFVHVYGPTENTVFSTGHVVQANEADALDPLPIGKALGDDIAVAVAAHGEPVHIGGEAELYLGGAGLATAYWGDPRRTALQFVPDHLSGRSGERFYRTGDVVRRLDDGGFAFIGRTDGQVKINGYRIELGEVEHHLMALDQVSACVAVARKTPLGQTAIVAYVVLTPGTAARASDIRRAASALMPTYMLPSTILIVDDLPLNANGKADLANLPSPAVDIDDQPAACLASPEEDAAAGIWERVIGAPVRQRDRDFFEMGGHSLAAMAACQIAVKEHGAAITLTEFLREPTLVFMAQRIKHAREMAHVSPGDLEEIEL